MKKILLSISMFMMIVSCNKTNELIDVKSNEKEYENLSKDLNKKFSSIFSPENINIVKVIDKNKDYSLVNIEINKNSNIVSEVLIKNYFTNLNSVQERVSIKEIYKNDLSSSRINSDGIDSYISNLNQYSEEYRQEIKSFIVNVENSEIENISTVINDFNNKIYESTNISDEEKIQLIAFSALTNSFSTFVKDGGLDETQNSIMEESGLNYAPGSTSNARVAAKCTVKWKDAFRSGVEGFFAGAIRGAYVGATVGTVSIPLPGAGTVTGAVSGAVVMGAAGFVGGVGGAVAKQVIWDCVLSPTSVDASCQYYYDKLKNNYISLENLPSMCLEGLEIDFSKLDTTLNPR